MSRLNRRILERGTRDHYVDAALYDYEYRRRRADVRFYRELARASTATGRARQVLELGCGSGRIALPLARAGVDVLGVDLSTTMLGRAVARIDRLPRAARARVQLIRADLRQLPFTRRFGLILAAFNTFQHVYLASELVTLFRGLRRRLRPGGCLAFDMLVPDLDWLVRDPRRRWAKTRFTHPTTGERLIYTTNHTYDPISQIVDVRIYYDPPTGQRGRSRVVRLAHRQYYPQELLSLVEMSGLCVAVTYGGFKGEPLSDDSESQLLLVCRPADVEAVGELGRLTVGAVR